MPLSDQRHLESLIAGLDQGLQAHLAWNQRLLRCVLLHEPPDEDIVRPDAHQRCVFGRWFHAERATLADLDAEVTGELERRHQGMHDAVRALCAASARRQPATAQAFAAYETGQDGMVVALNALRQKLAVSVRQHDALTGLPLRHGLHYAFDLRQRDAARSSQPLHLVMADADHFKRVNDTWGHPVGDLALQHLARLMSSCLRENDVLVRYGGEEFLMLLLGHGAETVVRRLLDMVRVTPMPLDTGPLRLTVTAGLTPVAADDTLELAVMRADQALLEGKVGGRDRYVIACAPGG